MEGRKAILKKRLEERGRVLSGLLVDVAAVTMYAMLDFFSERWRYGDMPEEEARQFIELNDKMLEFWVSQGEE